MIKRDFDGFLKIYTKNNGAYYKSCEEFGITRKTIDAWRKESPEFQEALDNIDKLINEKVEKSLLEEALEGTNVVAKIFWLKNNWRDKYGDHVEHEVTPSKLWFQPKDAIEGEIVEPKQLEE